MSNGLRYKARFVGNMALVLLIGTFIGSGDLMQWAINRMVTN
ncbi:MAG TPA: hypothetical protein VK978_03425 [Candidatus Saccharimonadales bacterium]|nr:hypothetical protein [Candidatus Saccharimonadales bacterium]